LLRSEEGKAWQARPGANNSKRYYSNSTTPITTGDLGLEINNGDREEEDLKTATVLH
jgi:hypothetical protein